MATKLTRNEPVVFHFRVRGWVGLAPSTRGPLPRGGATVVYVPDVKRFGVSVCSRKDVYSRKMGRRIAAGRAVSKNSFWDGGTLALDGSVPDTMESVRSIAVDLACTVASPIIGDYATRIWKQREITRTKEVGK